NRIHGFDADRAVEGVHFINLRINGQLIMDAEQGNIDVNAYIKDISFHF
ncbi:MAG: Parallel beta-helix repeat protein, partial [Paenibacillus sp.]|nr:Parallel beta-helix repeat protein [Paenibacillus sp.]